MRRSFIPLAFAAASVLLLMVAMILFMSAPALAQESPTATPIVAEAGTGAIQIRYWNGLTGSDGVTMN